MVVAWAAWLGAEMPPQPCPMKLSKLRTLSPSWAREAAWAKELVGCLPNSQLGA